MNTIKLYRGDSDKIEEFDFNKTNKSCLLGQGIYLTNNLSVAETYRTKGARNRSYAFVATITAKTKTEAIASALKQYIKHYKGKNEKGLEKEFKEKIEKEVIKITRLGYYQQRNQDWHFEFQEKEYAGYISIFEFPEPFFTRNCINFDASDPDKHFLEILENEELWINEKFHTEFLKNKRHTLFYETRAIKFNKLINILKDYGVHGFEYNGGKRLGGTLKHRAFSVWDEEFVNRHKVGQVK